MAVSASWFTHAMSAALGSESAGGAPNIDWLSDAIKVALFTNAHAPDAANDEFYDGAHGMTEVANGNGYTTGGATLGTKTLANSGGVTTMDAADTSWPTSTITARYAIVYDSTPASNKPMLGYVDFGVDVQSTGGTFLITWSGSGILTLTAA